MSKHRALSFAELVTTVWFVLDACTHLTIELSYLFLALTTTAEKSDTYFGHIWREYGRADKRWSVRDPTVISLEIVTVALLGPLCALQLYGVLKRRQWRHSLQIVICTAELYGGWMTFCPEWVDGSPNLDGSSFALFWIYLVFMNGLWVLVPAILLADSVSQISQSVAVSEGLVSGGKDKPVANQPFAPWAFPVIAGSLALYVVLVPAVLFTAEGVPVSS